MSYRCITSLILIGMNEIKIGNSNHQLHQDVLIEDSHMIYFNVHIYL